jgi:hypothetical protein
MHRHEMQQSNIYLGIYIYIIEYYFFWKNQGVTVVQCNNHEKVLPSSHQLSGPTADYWDAYMKAHEEPESINWLDFRAAFRAHHVPQGVIKLKEF